MISLLLVTLLIANFLHRVHASVKELILFLDQELVSYRYLYYGSCCWTTVCKKSQRLHRFKSDRDEIWLDCSSSEWIIRIAWHRLFDLTSRFQNGGHNVISRRKVLPSGDCTRSVCPAYEAASDSSLYRITDKMPVRLNVTFTSNKDWTHTLNDE